MKRVLVCEDEDAIREFVVLNLKHAHYDVVDVSTGEDALRVFEQEHGNFDVVVLDIMMPGIDGITVLKRLRERSKTVGIIMLSAKSQEMDKVNALMNEADDYITKPFAPSELTVRVDALHRRVTMNAQRQGEEDSTLESGPFVLNPNGHTVTKNGVPIELTKAEFRILEYFLKNKNTALDRASILANAWDNYYGDNKIVDVNIRRLRMKIEDDPSAPQYIITIWGYGYKWEEKPDTRR